ncbi:MAG TPA: hypothetical protein VF166_04635 [Gemmatimonadaceae bacterium]
MRTIVRATFVMQRVSPGAPSLENVELVRCRFDNCHALASRRPGDRWLIRNVRLTRCVEHSCSLNTTALEDVAVEGLKHEGRSLPFLWCCVFRHVTLTGRIAAPKVNEAGFNWTDDLSRQWLHANEEYYAGVDWALDLRGATFSTFFTLPGVPADLVRRDPTTQFVLRRERVMAYQRPPDQARTIADIVIDNLVASGLPDVVVVTGQGSRKFAEHLRVMEELREAGVAE